MITQYGIKLAVHIITTDFGNLVAKVCECLLRRGTLAKAAIARYTELPADKVTKSLWVLIQHNCIQAFSLCEEGDFGETERVSTQYIALFDNIIYRLRFPKCLSIVSKSLGEECASLLEGLLQHGRLTLSQILDRAKGDFNEGGNAHERFMQLVGARFVERCPTAEPLVSAPEEPPQKTKGARSNKTMSSQGSSRLQPPCSSESRIIQKVVTLEDRVISAATLSEAERFSVVDDTGKDAAVGNKSNSSTAASAGKKRKHNLPELDGDLHTSCNKDPIWRVNFQEFKRLFRNKACVKSARTRLDDKAGTVLGAILEATKTMENKASLSLDAISEELINSKEGRELTLEHVRAFLAQLGCNSADEGELYTLDLNEIIKHAQNVEIESVVMKRYGKDAYRLFRLLSENRHKIETSKISGRTLADQKDTKKILYKLWIANYLQMESVRRPQEEFFWGVNPNMKEQILDELYHAALNVRIRVAHEMDRGREVLMLDRDKRVGEAGKSFQKLRKVKMLLDSSLALLDDSIMLFHDF